MAGRRCRKPGRDRAPIEEETITTTAGYRHAWIGAAAALLVALAACSPQRETTPLPTKQTTIDQVTKKLDAAGAQAEKRREEMDAATK